MGDREYIIRVVEVLGRRRWYGVRRPSHWGYYVSRDGRPVARGVAVSLSRCDALRRAANIIAELEHGAYTGARS